MTWLRALAAAGLSLLLPGAGHALLRDWFRAFVFVGLFVTATIVFLPSELWSVSSVSEAQTIAQDETSRMAQFTISFLYLFAAIDAGFRALGFPPGSGSSGGDDGPSCPECGKELDEDLTFCHWCTTRLESPEGERDEETAAEVNETAQSPNP